MKKSLVFIATLGLGIAHMAQAAVFDLSGTTAGKALINVPYSTSSDSFQPFDAFEFMVSAAGSYGLVSYAPYDNYTLLYQGSFNASRPLDNLIDYNDDFISVNSSAVSFFLRTDTKYIFVNTAYEGSGGFDSTITGPGNVIPVLAPIPEPASVTLMLAGLGMIAPLARKRYRPAVDRRAATPV